MGEWVAIAFLIIVGIVPLAAFLTSLVILMGMVISIHLVFR